MGHIDDTLLKALEEEPQSLTSLVVKNRRLITCLIILLVGAATVATVISMRKARRMRDFIAFETLKSNFTAENESQLQSLLQYGKNYPELSYQIHNLISSALLVSPSLGSSLANEQLQTSDFKSYASEYDEYARGSKFIRKGEYTEALKCAVSLNAKLEDRQQHFDDHPLAMLTLFNQLRLALIFRELKQVDKERAMVDNLTGALKGMNSASSKSKIDQFIEHFTKGGLSVEDYLEYRRKTLGQVNS